MGVEKGTEICYCCIVERKGTDPQKGMLFLYYFQGGGRGVPEIKNVSLYRYKIQ